MVLKRTFFFRHGMSRHQTAWGALLRVAVAAFWVLAGTALLGCQPSDQRPGQWLSGELEETLPEDWRFSDNFPEIYVQVSTPFLIPHSVTIWCAHLDGALFIGARDPETKNWPGWMERDPDVRLKIGDRLFDVTARDFDDEATLSALRAAYARKYDLAAPTEGQAPNVRYWAIGPRS